VVPRSFTSPFNWVLGVERTITVAEHEEVADFNLWMLAVEDDDGVPDEVEDGVPGGDGNGDGIADSGQSNVTSLPSSIDVDNDGELDDYVTVAAPEGTTLGEVSVLDPADQGVALPPGLDLPWGLIDFTLEGVAPGSTVQVEVFLPPGLNPDSYWKLVDLDHDGTPDTYLDYTEHANLNGNPVIIEIQDNGFGDDDPTPGRIHDRSQAGVDDTVAPMVQCPTSMPVFLLNQAGAEVVAVVVDGDAGPDPASGRAVVDTSAIGVFSVELVGRDLAGNQADPITCSYGVVYEPSAFSSPIDKLPKVNSAKAGQTIPVKWRLTDANGAPVSDPASFDGLTSTGGPCASGPVDAVEAYVSAASGLQYQGDGVWQFNWKTDKKWSGHCRTLTLSLSDGTAFTAQFKFK
jgi:hypothetical protein